MYRAKRRDFLEQVTALGAVSTVMGWRPNLARAGAAPERSGGKMSYDPTGKFELKIGDVEFPRTPKGRQLMAPGDCRPRIEPASFKGFPAACQTRV
ncbi:MAG: hypothetical protein E6K82_15155 [Candidatus Rokuibacteriota bacterium]|nr:MAG: hypothetical protein E6K82_15155 [Candidatus Rokubacteria bacterium]